MNAPAPGVDPSPAIPLASPRGRFVLAATIIASGMVFLDSSVVNVALPLIQRELGAPLSSLQWILDAYALFLAALLLVGGALGDAYGRREVFLAGLVLFTAASAACGLAPTVGVLIAARAVQGVGGALLVPGSLAMIKAVISEEDSSRAIGLWTGLSGVTTAIGPLVGGYLAGAISWRTIFFVNVPLAIVALWVTVRYVPPNRDPNASRDLDWLGAGLAIAGLGGVTYGLIQGSAQGWRTPSIVVSIVVGVVCSALFLLREARARHPMVPLRLFGSSNFSGSNLVTLGVYFCFSGVALFLVLNLQQVQGYSPLQAGLSLSPISLLLMVLSPRMGGLMARFGARIPMVVGLVIVTCALLLFMLPGRHVSYPLQILPGLVLMGIGMSIFITPLTATVMSSVPPQSVGVASGINNAVSRVAALLAIAILGAVIAGRFDTALSSRIAHVPLPAAARAGILAHRDRLAGTPVPSSLTVQQRQSALAAIQDAFIEGYRWALALCVALCVLCAGLSAWIIRDPPLKTSEHPAAG